MQTDMPPKASIRKPVLYYGDAAKAGQRVPITVKKKLAAEDEECKISVPFERIMNASGSTRALEYRRRKFEWKEPLHWGQIKLFSGELEFLTTHGHLASTVVYAGAADGRHIPFLANIFKNHHFSLWDPAPMYEGYKTLPNIEFHQELFTDNIARSFADAKSPILFISDIRSMPEEFDYGNMTPDLDEEIEEDVKRDMQLQKDWCEIMHPEACMLKFRLPYTPGETEYLDGDIHWQAFAAETSSETRLVVNKAQHAYKMRVYNHELYENCMYRFNRCTRIQSLDAFDVSSLSSLSVRCVIEKIKEAQALFSPVPLSYDVLAYVYIVQKYLDIRDIETVPGEIIHQLNLYLCSNFQRKYEHKKVIHEKHLVSSKAKYENKDIL